MKNVFHKYGDYMENDFNNNEYDKYFNELLHNLRSFKKSYLPSYNDLADYNTNSQSYYDYLAKFNKILSIMIEYINELMNRTVNVEDTETIDLTKLKDWKNCANLCPKTEKNTEILIKGDVIFSKENVTYQTLRSGTQTLNNATYNLKGVFTPNFKKILDLFDNDINENLKKILKNIEDIKNHYNEFLQFKRKTENDINEINNKISVINNKLQKIENDINEINNKINLINQTITQLKTWHNENLTKINNNIQQINQLNLDLEIMSQMLIKIVNNLYESGAIDSNQSNFNFINNIANGKINIFTKNMDSEFFIKTNKNKNDYDLAIGVDA